MKIIRKWSHFSKIETFFCQEMHFSKKYLNIWTYFTRISEFFRKIIYRLSMYREGYYKSKEIPDEVYYLVEISIKRASKDGLAREALLRMGDISWNFRRKLTEIWRIISIWRMFMILHRVWIYLIYIWYWYTYVWYTSGMESSVSCVKRFAQLYKKWRKLWNIPRKVWDFLIKIYMNNSTVFSQF